LPAVTVGHLNHLKIGLAEKHFEYARPFHSSLIRENRLIAGIYTLSELDEKLRQMSVLMDTEAAGCTYEDTEMLAR
jgi:hypothetical protein